MESLRELLAKNRSYRRFDQSQAIPAEDLVEWVANVRLAPSAGNLQPLRFVIVNDPQRNREIFRQLKWAMYLKEWNGPQEGEKPSAYIVVLARSRRGEFVHIDTGIALQTILLGASEKGYGGCAVASCDRERIRTILGIEESLDIVLVIALGKPCESVIIEDMRGDDVRYWRDEAGVHHVPKRRLEDMLYRPVRREDDSSRR